MAKVLLASACLLLTAGCQTLGFYAQAVGGQLEIWREARPIESVLAKPDLDPALRARLQRIAAIRDFASRELALPDNGSFRSYADLGRPFVVWNVFATPELSLQPRQWCFLFAGCVAYRGYFDESAARDFARRQAGGGDDVVVAGVPAYSTLGWFDDPVLNTFVAYPETELARLLFHELSHQVAYVRDDTVFNESFAVAVELEGVARWLARNGTGAQREAWERAQARKRQFFALIERTRARLASIYEGGDAQSVKRARKAEAFAALRAEYGQLKQGWGGFAGYDFWIEEPLNNAKLVPLATYSELVPGFQRLLEDSGGDLAVFYDAVKALARQPAAKRRIALTSGLGGACRDARIDAANGAPDSGEPQRESCSSPGDS